MAPVSTRKVVGCPLIWVIISSSVFKGIWGQIEADPFEGVIKTWILFPFG